MTPTILLAKILCFPWKALNEALYFGTLDQSDLTITTKTVLKTELECHISMIQNKMLTSIIRIQTETESNNHDTDQDRVSYTHDRD